MFILRLYTWVKTERTNQSEKAFGAAAQMNEWMNEWMSEWMNE